MAYLVDFLKEWYTGLNRTYGISSLVESKGEKDNNASRSSQINSSSRFVKPKASGLSASGGLGATGGPSGPSMKKASVTAADAFVKPFPKT